MKKLLTLLLTLSLLLSLGAPALAVDDPVTATESQTEETDYDRGYDEGYDLGAADGALAGKADALAGTPKYEDVFSYVGEGTYEEGLSHGKTDGYSTGYYNGYFDACGRDPLSDQEILALGGVLGRVNVMLDGQLMQFTDAAPKIVDSRTMIPVRAVMEEMEAQVDYDNDNRVVTISKDGTTVFFTIGSTTISIQEKGSDAVTTEQMDCAPYIDEHNRTMVPLRFLSQSFGYTVLWDSDYYTAVVVDAEALIAQVDSRFTCINAVLAQQLEAQVGQTFHQQDSLVGDLQLYDAQGKAHESTFSLEADSYTNGGTMTAKMDFTADLKDTVYSFAEAYPELLESLDMDLSTLLKIDLSNITASLLLAEDGCIYFNMPLLNTLALGSSQPDKLWLKLGELGAGSDLGTFGVTMGQALVPSLLIEQDAFHVLDTVDMSVAMVEAMFGDAVATEKNGVYTWETDLSLMLKALGADLTEEDMGVLDGFHMTFSMGKDGSYTIDAALDGSELGFVFAADAAGDRTGGDMNLLLSMDSLFDLTLVMESVVETVNTLPDFTLPADAVVQDLTGLL